MRRQIHGGRGACHLEVALNLGRLGEVHRARADLPSAAACFAEGREMLKNGANPAVLERGLPKTRAALCEALRLRPPAWAFDREVQRPVTLPGGIELRRRDILLLSPYAQHHNPSVFADPDRYDPSRFLRRQPAAAAQPASGAQPSAGSDPWDGGYGKFEYFPFGQGRRRCLGYRFARWEMLVLLATLLAKVDISRPAGYVAPTCDGSVTLRPAAEFELLVRRRDELPAE